MGAVAADLNAEWVGGKTRVHFVPEYYNHGAVDKWLAGQGINEKSEGFHDSFALSATLASVDPVLIRAKQRRAAKKFSINGIELIRSKRPWSGARRSSSSAPRPQ